jgi:ElaB/YqjD/DUF883 family membrane-anchored ribosome-binding protein
MSTMSPPTTNAKVGSSGAVTDALAQDLRALTRDAEALISSTAHSAGDAVDRARDQLQSRLEHVSSRLQELQQTAQNAVKDSAQRADAAAHQHPYAVMGAAAAVGLMVGFLLGRR